MNRRAYYAGKLAASEKYLLRGFLLDMNEQQDIARQERDRCSHDFEIWYWSGQIDYIQQFQADKNEPESGSNALWQWGTSNCNWPKEPKYNCSVRIWLSAGPAQ
jgi:hypothetical protein